MVCTWTVVLPWYSGYLCVRLPQRRLDSHVVLLSYWWRIQYSYHCWNIYINKKVLLRERKRHTARRVVSTPSVILTGYPPVLTWPRGVPCQGGTLLGGTLLGVPYLGTPHPGPGAPCQGVPCLGVPCRGYPTWVPPAWPGVPCWEGTLPGYPHPSWPGGYPARGGNLLGGTQPGYPPSRVPPHPDLAGYPPKCLPHGILGNVAKHYGIWVPALGVDWQTKWNYYLPIVLRTRAVTTDHEWLQESDGWLITLNISRILTLARRGIENKKHKWMGI